MIFYLFACLFFNSDLTKKRGWGTNQCDPLEKQKQKPPPNHPRSQRPELFTKLLVLSLEGHFSHPFILQGKISSMKQTFLRFQLFKRVVLVIKGVFKPPSSLNLPTNMGNHQLRLLQLTQGCSLKGSHNSQLLIMQTTWETHFPCNAVGGVNY